MVGNRKNAQSGTGASLNYKAQFCEVADAPRGNMEVVDYKPVVLGLIFLKYNSDAFAAKHAEPEANCIPTDDPDNPNENRLVSIFCMPKETRWSPVRANAVKPARARNW